MANPEFRASSVKLHKALADTGLGSRRQIERWIAAGRVEVNGERAEVGLRVTPKDRISVDGRVVACFATTRPRVLVMNKPIGYEVSRRPGGDRQSVFSKLPPIKQGRWLSVGRLDLNTSGLLLFSNHGELTNRLSHPRTGLDREYAVRIKPALTEEATARLLSGVRIGGVVQRFSDIQHYGGRSSNQWYHVVLMEGRNREVRNLFATEKMLVSRLKRVRYGPVVMASWIKQGQVAEMSSTDVFRLCHLVGVICAEPSPNAKEPSSVLIPYPGLPEE